MICGSCGTRTQACRACKQPIRFVTSAKTGTTWQVSVGDSDWEIHMCQEYLDNLRNNVKGYFLPKRWSYAPATIEEWKTDKHVKAEYRRRNNG